MRIDHLPKGTWVLDFKIIKHGNKVNIDSDFFDGQNGELKSNEQTVKNLEIKNKTKYFYRQFNWISFFGRTDSILLQ